MQFSKFRTSFVAVAWVMAAGTASAQNLQWLDDQRSVASSGSASTTVVRSFYDGSPDVTVIDESLTKPNAPILFSGPGTFFQGDGFSLLTTNATLQGQGFQESHTESSGMRFRGVADVFANSTDASFYGADYYENGYASAGGVASSTVRWQFSLASFTAMTLTMDSNASLNNPSGYSFSLMGSNGFLWDAPYFEDTQGNILFSFSKVLALAPGTYTLSANLYANAFASGTDSRAGRATAEFSLLAQPVPEPETYALLLAGLFTLLVVKGRRRPRGWH